MIDQSAALNCNGLRFVVAEDESAFRALVIRTLKGAFSDCTVSECCDGAEALKAIENDPGALVVTDFNMPGMSGAQLALTLRERHIRATVVVLSSSEKSRFASLAAGADGFLGKSRLSELPGLIEQLAMPGELALAA